MKEDFGRRWNNMVGMKIAVLEKGGRSGNKWLA